MPIASSATRAPLAAAITACDVVARPYNASAASSCLPAAPSNWISPRPTRSVTRAG